MDKIMKTKLIAAAVFALTASTVQANESQAYCDRVLTQAQGQQSLLGSAEAFVNVGDPSTGAETMTAGVRKSISKHLQSGTVRSKANLQCEVYSLEMKLMEQADSVEGRSDLVALDVLEPALKEALRAAERNLRQEQAMLAAQTAKLSDVQAAFSQVDTLRIELAKIQHRRAQLQDMLPEAEQP